MKTTKEIVIASIIHFVIPLVGLLYFLWLKKQMKKENTQNPPAIALFVIFVTYGGLVVFVLTALFWYWSGMASLGLFYLIFMAPIKYCQRFISTFCSFSTPSFRPFPVGSQAIR